MGDRFHFVKQGHFGDRLYRELSVAEGYFFEFLWQLPQLSCAGIGQLSLDMLAAESYGKFTAEDCRTLLAALQARSRVIYDDEWLWVVNYFKYKPGGSMFVLLNAKKSLVECESRLIFDGWQKKYAAMESVKKIMGKMVFAWDSPQTSEHAEYVLGGIEGEPEEMHLFAAEVEAVWKHYTKKMKTEGILTARRREKILERLREDIIEDGVPRTVGVQDLMRAISNCTKSHWHMGRDPKSQGHKYNSLEDNILVNQEKFLYWLRYDPLAGKAALPAGEMVYREETPSPTAKWSGERASAEEVKAIVKRTVKKLGGPPDGGTTERVFRG